MPQTDFARFLQNLQLTLRQNKKSFGLSYNLAGKLELTWNEISKERPFCVDYESPLFHRRLKSAKSELLFAATGFSRSPKPWNLWDFTGGVGRDCVVLASCGCNVVVYERNPILYALLFDGLRRLEATNESYNIKLWNIDSTSLSNKTKSLPFEISSPPEVIYLDPMYSSANTHRKSKSRKETQILQRLYSEEDSDGDNSDQISNELSLLRTALSLASGRVVVKRGINASPLCGREPQAMVKGSTQRFDIYYPQHSSNLFEK